MEEAALQGVGNGGKRKCKAVGEGKGEGLTVIGFPSITTPEQDIVGD